MSESERGDTRGRCRLEMDAFHGGLQMGLIADALDRLAADVASIKAKVDAVSPEDVAHLVESEKAFAELFAEQRDAARAEVERLNAELAARPAGDSPEIPDSSPAAPQQAAPPPGWLTDDERELLQSRSRAIRRWLVGRLPPPIEVTREVEIIDALLARAGSPPVVEVPELGFLGPMTGREQGIVLAYRDALDAAGVKWKEVGRE